MKLITDREKADVLLKTPKGQYGPEDLNRVEGAVAELSALAKALDVHYTPETKTDWDLPGAFSANTWPTQQQMARYLGNVAGLCAVVEVSAGLPGTMENLSFQDANRIEAALEAVYMRIQRVLQIFRYSGTFFAGEENRL